MILYTQRKETFVIGARGGHVACTTEKCEMGLTLNDLFEALKTRSKKSTEGHQNTFARIELDC
jgi:hypothetical protein